jgi:hypothetical protein
VLALSAPGLALAQSRIGLASLFGDSGPIIKLLMVALVVAALAAIVVTGLKLSAGRRLAGGSSFVSALRAGGPLIGLLGAVFNLLSIFIGIANAGAETPLAVLSPGFAEAAMVLFLGLFAGVIAVICHWIIEARIDRTVLSS